MKGVKDRLRFIDLFAGLGGFHQALASLGCECVLASEIREDLRELYKINFPHVTIEGDITKIDPKKIPAHDILCAGFPCQPFSQAGNREGFNDKERGNLFYNICAILEVHHPRYVMLENVANLKGHDKGNTWNTIRKKLEELNYHVYEPQILSPHQWGIPQHRRRIYIVCELNQYWKDGNFEYPEPQKNPNCNIKSIIKEDDEDYIHVKPETRKQMSMWQRFVDEVTSRGQHLPHFPIWAMEFGADYDFEETAPYYQPIDELRGKKGKLGNIIDGETKEECINSLPIYAQTGRSKEFPSWKKTYIRKNREFYELNRDWLDEWLAEVKDWENSHLKFEWNCGDEAEPTLHDKIIQFRASGIRVKLPTFCPALNLVGTQIPIFPWVKLPSSSLAKDECVEGRYMTRTEAARVQGMGNIKFGNEHFKLTTARSFEALGNAVNVDIVRMIAEKLLKIK